MAIERPSSYDHYRPHEHPGAAARGFEAVPPESSDRAREGDLGVKGLPAPKFSFESGSKMTLPFKNLKGGR